MFKHHNWKILFSILVLGGFSLAVIQSVMPALFVSQLVFYIVGLVIYFVFSLIDFEIYRPFWFPIYVVSCFLLLGIYLLGIESHGAVRWIEFAGFRLQLSEVLKPFFLLSFASFLADRQIRRLSDILKTGLYCIIPFFLVLKQPDLGSAIIYLLAFFSMVFMARIPMIYLITGIVGLVSGTPAIWHFLHDYQRNRILSFLNPESDPRGASYNAIQATIAVGSGMFFGKGLGHGTQSQLLFLPEKHTDFVFASLVEELGLFGAMILLASYALIFFELFKVIAIEDDRYGNLYLFGVIFMLLGQMFINIGMNIGLVPVTGITLPFISYGGSSVIALMITLGIAQNIAKSRG